MNRVIITDDHPVVRAGLRALLEASGITVLAEASNGHEAIDAVKRLTQRGTPPDVVLMDLQMPSATPGMGDGVCATAAIRDLPDAPRVLILTTYDTDADILRAVEAGATGYLLKDAPPNELIDGVHRAARGETVLAPVVAQRMMQRLAHPATALTEREQEVLRLVAQGNANRSIARELFISEATVKTHLVHIFTKLDAHSRTDAVTKARELGLLR